MKIKLVVATRLSEEDFYKKSALGRSVFFPKREGQGLASFRKPAFLDIKLFSENKVGLPELYNQAIRECKDSPATLVFAHDDLYFLDFFWCSRIVEGLKRFDVIGIAGNKRRTPGQPSWAFLDTKLTWDSPSNLSGVVANGFGFPPQQLNIFGTPRQKVLLLDGLLLAAHSETLICKELFFDEQFDFHFYDMDFCRQAESRGVSCGTWDLALIHESAGNLSSPAWASGYRRYLQKWGD